MDIREVKYLLGRSSGEGFSEADGRLDGVSIWECNGVQRVSIMWTTPEHVRTETVLMGDTLDLIHLLAEVIRYLEDGYEGVVRG
jgi:hypothetical protein